MVWFFGHFDFVTIVSFSESELEELDFISAVPHGGGITFIFGTFPATPDNTLLSSESSRPVYFTNFFGMLQFSG